MTADSFSTGAFAKSPSGNIVRRPKMPVQVCRMSERKEEKTNGCDCGDNKGNSEETLPKLSRRSFTSLTLSATLAHLVSTSGVIVHPTKARALWFDNELPETVLLGRVTGNGLEEPRRKLYSDDLYYPLHFRGLWKVRSTLVSVQCPAGYKLFGQRGSFERAQQVSFSSF